MEFQTIHSTDSNDGKETLAQTVVQYLFDLGEAHHHIQVENFNFHNDNENETISFDSYEDIVDFIGENSDMNGYFYNNLNGQQINIHPDFDGKMPLNFVIDLLMNFGATLINNLYERN